VDYRGLSVARAAELRTRLRDADARFRVVKNTLTERAADEAGAPHIKALLTGPTALTFVRGDAALAAKALADTARATQILEFKGGVLNGAAISAADVQSIARLPSRQVLYGQLVGMVASPLTGLARTLNALVGGLAVALGQVRDRGLVSGEAPAPAAEEIPPAPAEETNDDPDSQPPEPVVQPDQAEGEDPTTDTTEPHAAVPDSEEDN
jgi:large subunit ribosomal protein L10